MSSPSLRDYNIKSVKYTKQNRDLLKKIFFKMSYIRQFELRVYENRLKKKFETLVYLCLGQESIYSAVSLALTNVAVFGQHRGHGIYLASKGNPKKLVDELIGLESGTNKGMGGSPPIFDRKVGMYGHVGLIGDQVPVAAGFSLVNKNKTTVCYFGDGAAEEDYVLATLGFASQKKLRILFICEDNDLSVLTQTKDRRSWKLTDVAKSFGINSLDITDDPLTIYYSIKKLSKNKLPALINIRTCREYWHEGAGKDKEGKKFWSRYKIVKKSLLKLKEENFIFKTENLHKKWSGDLWQKRLQKL